MWAEDMEVLLERQRKNPHFDLLHYPHDVLQRTTNPFSSESACQRGSCHYRMGRVQNNGWALRSRTGMSSTTMGFVASGS